MRWQEAEIGPDLDGYNMWELDTAGAVWDGDLMLPAFVELSPGNPAASGDAIDALLALNLSGTGDCALAGHEAEHLARLRATALDGKEVVQTVVYCRPGSLSNAKLWRVLSVGAPVARAPRPTAATTLALKQAGAIATADPIIAIIDDGIGFLNARFRKTAVQTRIEAMWIMGPDRSATTPPDGGVVGGRVLTAADIDAMLALGGEEADHYRAVNDALFPPGLHRSTERAFGHGTLVLDLAAGKDIAAGPAEGRILAVQLPPEAIAATSGRRLEHYILQGLRWIFDQAVSLTEAAGRPAPLIVNLSLGALAGPKDGTGFFESWLRREIAAFERNPRSANIPLRIVAAYGNSRRARLVAERQLQPGQTAALTWQVLPDDRTASYLELRVPKAAGGAVSVDLVPPGAFPALHLPAFLTGRRMMTLKTGPTYAAGVFAMDESAYDTMLVALAPTVAEARQSVSEPGPWKLVLRNGGTEPCEISARIRRDDTPSGFRMAGRQSWLDDADGWSWDSETMDWSAPNLASLITRQGTEVNFSSISSASVYFVAAGEPDTAAPDALRPSPYSAEGMAGRATAPTLLARADDGRVRTGRRGAGLFSGSSRRMTGTSIAAPLAVAALAEGLVQGRLTLAPRPQGSQPDGAELSSLTGTRAPATLDPRSGAGSIPG